MESALNFYVGRRKAVHHEWMSFYAKFQFVTVAKLFDDFHWVRIGIFAYARFL